MELQVDIAKAVGSFDCRVAFSLTSRRCGIFGPSGSGKSTLINMLAGLLKPDSGRICLDGTTLFDSRAGIDLPPERRRIGVVFQHARLFPHMKVGQNLFYGMNRTAARERTIDADRMIDILQIGHLLSRPVAGLSGGERQRVALGRSLLACPRLILLDEPLTGLDRTLKFHIIPHLQHVFAEFAIPLLFISHSLQEMRLLTDEVLVMEQGRLLRHIPTEELARSAMGGERGYINLLDLRDMQDLGQLLQCRWGEVELMLMKNAGAAAGVFALGSRDILLFKQHPQATSARNMLSCIVRRTYPTDWLVGVELDCRGQTLITEIVPQSLAELDIRPGREIMAVFKASALRRLY